MSFVSRFDPQLWSRGHFVDTRAITVRHRFVSLAAMDSCLRRAINTPVPGGRLFVRLSVHAVLRFGDENTNRYQTGNLVIFLGIVYKAWGVE